MDIHRIWPYIVWFPCQKYESHSLPRIRITFPAKNMNHTICIPYTINTPCIPCIHHMCIYIHDALCSQLARLDTATYWIDMQADCVFGLSPWTHSQWCVLSPWVPWAPERTLNDVSPWTHSQWCEPLNALSVMCLEPLNALSMMRAPERTLSDVSRAPERTLNDASPWTHSQWCVLSPWTHSQWCATPQHICRVGQNLIYTPYMTVHFLISLPKIPYVHRRVGQNHIYTVYIRYLRQGNHQVYGHINNYGQLYVLTHLLDLFRLLAQSILFDRCPACLAGSFWRCPCHRWAVRALFTKKGTLEQQRWTMPKNTS